MEVIQGPLAHVLDLLTIAIGLTAITFIAIVIHLDLQQREEPVTLPEKS